MSVEQLLKDHTAQDASNFELIREDTADLKEDVRGLRHDVSELRAEIVKYKGFVGGIAFTLSAIVTVVGLAIAYFKG